MGEDSKRRNHNNDNDHPLIWILDFGFWIDFSTPLLTTPLPPPLPPPPHFPSRAKGPQVKAQPRPSDSLHPHKLIPPSLFKRRPDAPVDLGASIFPSHQLRFFSSATLHTIPFSCKGPTRLLAAPDYYHHRYHHLGVSATTYEVGLGTITTTTAFLSIAADKEQKSCLEPSPQTLPVPARSPST